MVLPEGTKLNSEVIQELRLSALRVLDPDIQVRDWSVRYRANRDNLQHSHFTDLDP